MLGIYEFYWDCGRMGELEGLFLADSKDVADAIGKTIYFGEVLGKHSEVEGTLNAEDINLKTDDQEFISRVIAIFGKGFGGGFDPIEKYLEQYDEPEDEDEE